MLMGENGGGGVRHVGNNWWAAAGPSSVGLPRPDPETNEFFDFWISFQNETNLI
jgi:hypothetical protein